jgi:hypothetical protein
MNAPKKNLPKTQQELLEAIKSGVTVTWLQATRGESYYYRCDNHKRVTAAARGLLQRGFVEPIDRKFYTFKLRAIV